MKPKAEIREHKKEMFCNTCHPANDGPAMTPPETKAHLEQVHKLTDMKGSRSLVMALDGDFYSNTFEWKIGGVTLTEIQSGPAHRH